MRKFNQWFESLPAPFRFWFFLIFTGVALGLSTYDRDTTPWRIGSILVFLLVMVGTCRKFAPYQELRHVRNACYALQAFLVACIGVMAWDLVEGLL